MFARTTLFTAIVFMTTQWGCQPAQPAPAPPQDNHITVLTPTDPSGKTLSPDEVLQGDPSAARLHDIEGDILLYYSAYRQMPAQLKDLQSVVGADTPLNLTSPASGQPYVYVSGGMWIPNRETCIIVYDPVLSSNGKRWCLTMIPPKAGGAVAMDVEAIPEAIFLSYQPAGR